MGYIEFEKSIKEKEWDMTDLHSHNHYEIYFLMTGTRNFFLDNKMYKISAPCLIVISPYTMHKTEGVGFSRININVAIQSLNNYQLNVLKKLSEKVITLSVGDTKILFPLLEEGAKLNFDDKYANEKANALMSYIILQMDKINENLLISPIKAKTEKVSTLSLKIIDYINSNFDKDITLDTLSNIFYISKTSICSQFKKAMDCTIIEYITRLKLNKAKELLTRTKKNVEEISMLCGFSSPAYFGLIFKFKIGLSPLNYRKTQKEKQ